MKKFGCFAAFAAWILASGCSFETKAPPAAPTPVIQPAPVAEPAAPTPPEVAVPAETAPSAPETRPNEAESGY